MPKLTDTQLVILSAAAKRADGAVLPPPRSLKVGGGALTRCLRIILKRGLVEERPATAGQTSWRETEEEGRISLAITRAGLEAIGIEPGQGGHGHKGKNENSKKGRKQKRAGDTKNDTRRITPPSPRKARAGTKQALLISLLKRKRGATIDEIVSATGWQAHSVRGAISGTLKKKLGLAVTSEKVAGRGRVYRIVEEHQRPFRC